jgi:iron complex outermembrane receptor protein
MKIFFTSMLMAFTISVGAQTSNADTTPSYRLYDTVTITALGRQPIANIPYSIQRVNLLQLQKTPLRQIMLNLSQLPSVSMINCGIGINKPVIRGLSFNHIQLFAQGTRFDNQTWDDRHDIGISENGFDKVEIISGPAALIYGPNTMGGAMIFSETPPARDEKSKGFVQLGFNSNSVGINIDAGFRGAKKDFYYSLATGIKGNTNYVQGGGKSDTSDSKPLAFNSKFTNIAFKGMGGIRKEKHQHQLTYNLYKQLLGIIEDESLEAINNPAKKEERDYEMEAPYQDVETHVISLENTFQSGTRSEFLVNAGYQFNRRKEFEPDTLGPKSKFLAVALDLSTITGDVQWAYGRSQKTGINIGVQGFHQTNKNIGNWVLVPDADINTIGGFVTAHYTTGPVNFLAGIRIDHHQIETMTAIANRPDTLNPPFAKPNQELNQDFTPFSFSAGLVYHATEQFSIKLNAASGYAAPNYAQLTSFGRHEGTFRFEIGDNNLNMEQNIEGDITLQWENEVLSASINGYYNHITDYIYIAPTADSAGPLRVYKWISNDANISGLELNLQLHPVNSWFEGYLRGGVIRGKLDNDAGDLPYIPANKLITGLTWKNVDAKKWMNPYVTLQIGAYAAQKKVAQFEEPTSGYVVTDIYAGAVPPFGRHRRWTGVIFINNIFNTGYFNHLSLIKTIHVMEPGRNLGFQLKYGF